jgi:hypothetical protein
MRRDEILKSAAYETGLFVMGGISKMNISLGLENIEKDYLEA